MFINLKKVLNYFDSSMQMEWSEMRSSFQQELLNGEFSISEIRKELFISLNDESWDWNEFAKDTGFIFSSAVYDSDRILLELKLLIWDFIFPDKIMNCYEIKNLYEFLIFEISETNLLSGDYFNIDLIVKKQSNNDANKQHDLQYEILRIGIILFEKEFEVKNNDKNVFYIKKKKYFL